MDRPFSIESIDAKLGRFSAASASLAALLGAVALAGWYLKSDALRSFLPIWTPVSPTAAACLLTGGSALLLWRTGGLRRNAGWILAVTGASIAAWSLAATLADGAITRPEYVLFGPAEEFAPVGAHETLAPSAGVAILLFNLGVGSLALRRHPWINPSVYFGIAAFAVALIGFVTRLMLPESTDYRLPAGSALALVFLSGSLIMARMGSSFLRTLGPENPASLLARRLLVAILSIPLLLCLAQMLWVDRTESAGFYPLVVSTIVYSIALVLVLVLSLRQLDDANRARAEAERERERLLASLQQQAATLQQQVAHRTAEIQEVNDRFALALRAADFGVWDWNVVTGHRVWDARQLAIFGRTADEVEESPDNWKQWIVPEDRPLVDSIGQRLLQNGNSVTHQFRIVRPDGSIRHIESSGVVHRDSDGRATRVVGLSRDITAAVEHEREVAALDERLKFALASSGYGVWSMDVPTRRMSWEERVYQIHGFKPGEFDGDFESIIRMMASDEGDRVGRLFQRFLEGEVDEVETEYSIRLADGSIRHVATRGYMQRGVDSAPVRVVGLARDITREKEREIELSTLNERLQFVVSAAGYGVWEYDFQNDRLIWDDRLIELFGMDRSEITGTIDDWRRRVHPEDIPLVREQFDEVISGKKEQYNPEYRIVMPGGSIRFIESRSYLIRNSNGSPQRMVGLNRDITSDRELREHLRITEERWRLALASSNDGVWDRDLVSQTVYRDTRYAEILGLSPEELPPTYAAWESRLHTDDRPMVLAALNAHLRGEIPVYRCEYRLRHKDGHWVWVLDRGKVVARDSKERPQRMVGTQTDVTHRRLLEDRLRHNEELSLQLSRLAQIGAWEVELPSKRITWAPEIYRIHEVELGYTPELESALAFYAPEARRALEHALLQAEREGTPFDLELPFTTARGHGLWVRVLGRAEVKGGVAVRIYGSFQDITARRDAEEMRRQLESQLFQAQKMETLGTLAGGIAHDFNNLLTGILGYQDLALDTIEEDSSSRNYLMSAREASMRARELVDQILTFSRQAGSEKVPVNLRMVVEDARRFLRATVPATIRIEIDIAANCPPVMADATQIHQVLLNLGSNAAHAMRVTGGEMRITLAPVTLDGEPIGGGPRPAPGRYVKLDFKDSGHGMDRETQKRIFDPFFTTKDVGQGTGLGLSVVHGIIQAHQGAINVHSEIGSGTTFTLYLPATDSGSIDQQHVDTAMPRGHGEMLAVVDDEDIVRSFAQMALEKIGYRVASFDQPKDCLEAIRKNPNGFTMLLTDQTMPVMKGIELATEVRKLAPTMPVIIMSGYFSRISSDTLASIGHVSLLSKPFTNDELARAIDKALHHTEEPADQPSR